MSSPYQQRFRVICPARPEYDPAEFAGFELVVSSEHPRIVEAALALIAFEADKLICVDWADVRIAAPGSPAFGVGYAFPSAMLERDLITALTALKAARFGEGFVLMRLVAPAGTALTLELETLDCLAEAITRNTDSPIVFSCALSNVGDWSVLMGFTKEGERS